MSRFHSPQLTLKFSRKTDTFLLRYLIPKKPATFCKNLPKTNFFATFCISRRKQPLLLKISEHSKYHLSYVWAKFQIKIPLFWFFYELQYLIHGTFSFWWHNLPVDRLKTCGMVSSDTLMLCLRIFRKIIKVARCIYD